MQLRDNYTPTIGIECHVQFKTKTKLFSGVDNDARVAPPNTLISHIDFGLPGALPVLNNKAVELAIRAAYALQVEPQAYSKFDRKHYFYPDLPMGYQITQYDEPIIIGGIVELPDKNKTKVRIVRAHLEADAGKSVHPDGKDYSLVDLNRSGTPLLEIVSEADMHSSSEAKDFARELYLLMKYADVSDANLFYGNMRFDVNVSVSNSHKLGIRTEIKNINSFRNVEKAVDYEVKRQIEQLSSGKMIVQETRGWNDAKQKTFIQRTKENAEDYRYMPDPDLPPIVINKDYAAKIKKSMPVMPGIWRDVLSEIGISQSNTELLIDAEVDDPNLSYLSLIKNNRDDKDYAKFIANWFINLEIPLRSEVKLIKLTLDQRQLIYKGIYILYKANKISSTNVKELLKLALKNENSSLNIEDLAKKYKLLQISDSSSLEKIIDNVLAENPKAVADIKKGETKAIGYLIGQIMKKSKSQADPAVAKEIIIKKIVK